MATLQAWFGHCAPDQSGGAYPRRLSRGATSRHCLIPDRTSERISPSSRPPILKRKTPTREAIEETGERPARLEFPAAASAGRQPFRARQLGGRRPAPSGIDPNANAHYIGASERLGKVFPGLLPRQRQRASQPQNIGHVPLTALALCFQGARMASVPRSEGADRCLPGRARQDRYSTLDGPAAGRSAQCARSASSWAASRLDRLDRPLLRRLSPSASNSSTTADRAKLTFDLSAPVDARAFVMADPDRIIIDMPEVNFQIDPAVGRAPQGRSLGPIVKSFRFGLFGPGKSRIVIDLAAPARVTRVIDRAADRQGRGAGAAADRTDALRARRRSCTPPTRPSSLPSRRANPAPAACRELARRPPTIVLDPGHGGVDGGAIGLGRRGREDARLRVHQRTGAKAGGQRPLSRRDDPQRRRVRLARRSRGDRARRQCRACSSPSTPTRCNEAADVSGATVYTVADRASDAEAARIAERENAADKAAGVEQTQEADGRRRHPVRSQAARDARLRPHLLARRRRAMARRGQAQPQSRALGGIRGAEGAGLSLGAAGTRLSLEPAGRRNR